MNVDFQRGKRKGDCCLPTMNAALQPPVAFAEKLLGRSMVAFWDI